MDDIISQKYQILEKIAEGGMGTVYKALQTDVERIVAVKILSPFLASDSQFRQRFKQEAVIIAQLNHPHIVNVIGVETYKDTFCIIMEFLEGVSLEKIIARHFRLDQKKAVHITMQLAQALHYAHSKGVIHRDIKPDNIVLLQDDEIKVTDFGIARWSESPLQTQTGMTMGTPQYMSPEQARGKKIDHRSDIYSMGLLLYHMVTGRKAFDSDNAVDMALLQEKPPVPPSRILPEIHPELERIILKAIEKEPEKRFQTAQEMASELENLANFLTPERKSLEAKPVPLEFQKSEPTSVKRDERFDISPVEKPPLEKMKIRKRLPLVWVAILFIAGALLIGIVADYSMRNPRDPVKSGEELIPTPVSSPSPVPTSQAIPQERDAGYYYTRAEVLRKNPGSDSAEIRKCYEKALDLDPDYYEALRDYGYYLYDQKEYTRAGAFLRKALESGGDSEDKSTIQNRLALIHEKTKP